MQRAELNSGLFAIFLFRLQIEFLHFSGYEQRYDDINLLLAPVIDLVSQPIAAPWPGRSG